MGNVTLERDNGYLGPVLRMAETPRFRLRSAVLKLLVGVVEKAEIWIFDWVCRNKDGTRNAGRISELDSWLRRPTVRHAEMDFIVLDTCWSLLLNGDDVLDL